MRNDSCDSQKAISIRDLPPENERESGMGGFSVLHGSFRSVDGAG